MRGLYTIQGIDFRYAQKTRHRAKSTTDGLLKLPNEEFLQTKTVETFLAIRVYTREKNTAFFAI